MERSKLDLKTNTELVEIMWEQFCDLGKYEANVIDTTAQTVSETVQSIKAHLKADKTVSCERRQPEHEAAHLYRNRPKKLLCFG